MSLRCGWFSAAFFVCFLIAAPRGYAQESWQGLIGRVPAEANVLMMVHADKVRTSKFATTSGWNRAEAATGGIRSLLPRSEVRRVLFAAHLTLGNMTPLWEAGLLETKSDASLDLFAAGVPTPTEAFGDSTGKRLRNDAYLLKLAPNLFGILGPADRQLATRWVRAAANDSERMTSPYLKKIAEFPQTVGTEVMLGLDLADAVDQATIAKVLAKSSILSEAKLDPAKAAAVLTSLEGVALGVRVLDQASGVIRIDFKQDPTYLAPVLKPLLLERLAAAGVMIDDFQDWKLDVQGNTAFVGGNLTPAGLNLVLSLIEPEIPAAGSTESPPGKSTATAKPSVEKTLQYFGKVRQIVTDVRFPTAEAKFVSAGAFGSWIDRQARRIDQLPILGVDPELVDYAFGVASSLRTTAAKQRGATIQAGASSGRADRYYDGWQTRTYESPRVVQTRMENAAANLGHVEIMRMIDDETAAMRRRMTERYQVEF